MKHFFLLFVLTIFSGIVIAQNKIEFKGNVDVKGKSKEDIKKELCNWFDGYRTFKDLLNNKVDTITGKGHFPFITDADLQGADKAGKEAIEKVNGMFTYTITLVFRNGGYSYIFTDFTHYPSDSKSDMDFGIITDDLQLPSNVKCTSDGEWCESIWKEMHRQIKAKAPLLIGTLPHYASK
ncbi:MAG: hypothetical protein C0594_00090 [Marinilabiliales bacterium]|nr:MAG: hypothetical protein C0594_00090 [Marinilabiliales bacterium]